jgi:hypothetical protein
LFTKVLAIRVMELANDIISLNQIAFIKGRNILEGVMVLHEVLLELKVRKQGAIILKLNFEKACDRVLNFEKACDRVHWDFMREVLVQKDFPSKWIQWVMQFGGGGGWALL